MSQSVITLADWLARWSVKPVSQSVGHSGNYVHSDKNVFALVTSTMTLKAIYGDGRLEITIPVGWALNTNN